VAKQSLINSVYKYLFFNFFFLSIIQTLFLSQVYGQTISINGRVASSRFPIRDASVTFIDNTDTTRKYSALTNSSGNYEVNLVVTGTEQNPNFPTTFELDQNYPNPFSSTTAIPYGLYKESNVQATIYDILGRVVRKFDVGQKRAGTYNILWDGRNDHGKRVASGIYFYRLNADGASQVKKMVFNQNGSGYIPIPHNFSLTKNSFSAEAIKIQNVQGNTFTIRVQNTSTTTPLIVPAELENVFIQNDTTINFSVTYIPVATVNFDSLHQYIRGFGAANILPWRPDMTDSEIETAFGPGEGQLGFTILRLMIQPDKNQWSMNVSTAKKAHDMGVIIFASPWDPPSDMLENVGGLYRVRYDMYDEYAEHLDSFYSYMTNNGIPLHAVSVQNEPDYGDWTRWTADEMFTFMKNNAQEIGTRVIAPESFQFRRSMSDPILNDSLASANLDIVGGHIYGAGLAAYPLAEQKGKEIWMTEHYTESSHSANLWPLAFDVAKEMQNVMQANMNAYVWWYIVRYYGPVGDGEINNSFPDEDYASKGEVTKRGYIMSQFSRFIRPGFYRVQSSIVPSISKVDVTAYKDPLSSKAVIVAVNSGTAQAETVFRIQNENTLTTLTPYTTSESKNCEQGNAVSVTDGNFTFTMEPLSITTFVSD